MIAEQTFHTDNLIQKAIIPQIVESLGPVYPELEKNFENICDVYSHVDELYKSIIENNRKTFKSLGISPTSELQEEDVIDFVNFPKAYRDIEKLQEREKSVKLSTEFIYEKLHISYGLSEEVIQKLAAEKNLQIDMNEFQLYKKMKRSKTKSQHQMDENVLFDKLISADLPGTRYQHMYDCEFDKNTRQFIVKPLKAKILLIVNDDNVHHIILDQTNFYHTAGGQDSDTGQMIDSTGECVFNVENVHIHKGYVIHSGRFMNETKPFKIDGEVNLVVDGKRRTHLSQHHTAMHLLQAATKQVTKQIVFQQSSNVSALELKCELGAMGKRVNIDQLDSIEKLICNIIRSRIPIETQHLVAHELYALNNLTTVPGAVYPDGDIRVVKVMDKVNEFQSIEPCCGTHARNTGELEDFCFLKVNSNNRSYDISAVAGELVQTVRENGKKFLDSFESFKRRAQSNGHSEDEWESLDSEANQMKRRLTDIQIPHITKVRVSVEMEDLEKQIRRTKRIRIKELVVAEMMEALGRRTANKDSFIVHVLETRHPLEECLVDAEQMCHDLPVIILNVSDNKIMQGRASIPLKYTNNKFNANHWISTLADTFNIKCSAAKNKSHFTQSKLKGKSNQKIKPEQLESAVQKTKAIAAKMFDEPVSADRDNRKMQEDHLLSKLVNIRAQLEREMSLDDIHKMNATITDIRNDVKAGLFSYDIMRKCTTELIEINDHQTEARHKIEK